MTWFTLHWARPFRLIALLALMAIAVRAGTPMGVMVTADQDHRMVVALCSGAGPVQLALNLETGVYETVDLQPTDHDTKTSDHAPCVFAAAAALATPSLDTGLALTPPDRREAITFSTTVTVGQGLAAPPPWATGPPHTL